MQLRAPYEVGFVNPLIIQVQEELSSAWRFRWLALAVAAALALVGWLVVFALPDRYEAVASVFVDTRTSLKPVLQGLTVEQDVDAQLNFVRQSLLAGPQLLKVGRESGVLPTGLDPRRQEQALADLSGRIAINVHSANGREEERNTAGSIYSIVYQDEDRARSLRVVTRIWWTESNSSPSRQDPRGSGGSRIRKALPEDVDAERMVAVAMGDVNGR